MDIKQIDSFPRNGKFYIELEDVVVAEMTYVWSGDNIIIIDHTVVDELLKGKGAGKQLLHAVVNFARNKGLKIIPLCPFAKSVFDKTPAYNDVLINTRRDNENS